MSEPPGRIDRRRGRLLAVIVMGSVVLSATARAAETVPAPEAPQAAPGHEATASTDPYGSRCPFCLAPISDDEFCARCGRLTHLAGTSSEHRFWGDTPYVLSFPPLETNPVIDAELTSVGLQRESVHYTSGDRFELTIGKKGPVVSGKVGLAGQGKEMGYSAKIQDTLNEVKKLISREVFARIDGSPDLYLYRKLDYRYDADGRLARIELKTWFYRNASDWQKRPSVWVRHSAGEIVLRRDEKQLDKIETTVREGGRSLRGEAEYGDPRVVVDQVIRAGQKIDRLDRIQP